ncbi:MAG: hypothetical protein WKF57_03740 [Nakamurella sp.]
MKTSPLPVDPGSVVDGVRSTYADLAPGVRTVVVMVLLTIVIPVAIRIVSSIAGRVVSVVLAIGLGIVVYKYLPQIFAVVQDWLGSDG